MTEGTLTPQDLVQAVEGDLDAFGTVLQQPHPTIQECRVALPTLMLSAQGVHRVLTALQRKQVSPEQVQRWASFVRRGYVARAGGTDQPVHPIEIEYDPKAEERIAGVISRLDEIGDLIDGEISDDELSAMIRSLGPGTK